MAKANDKSAPKGGAKAVTQLQVTARRAGFRRAGRAWPAEAVTVSADDFTAEQVEQLLAEPMLTVTSVAEGGE